MQTVRLAWLQLNPFPEQSRNNEFQISLVAQMVKRLSTMRETRGRSLGGKDLLEKEMTTHSSILVQRIPWTKDPGLLWSWGHKESGTTEHEGPIDL